MGINMRDRAFGSRLSIVSEREHRDVLALGPSHSDILRAALLASAERCATES